MRETPAEGVAVALLVPLLLAVAIWNRFPIIYYDTGAYVLEGLGGHFLAERAPVYSLFLRYCGAGTTLWLVAVAQSLFTALVMTEAARAVAPRLSLNAFLALSGALVIGTGLPWYVGQIEPDCFTAVLVLAIYLVAFHGGTLGLARPTLLIALGGLAAAAHPSHLLLAAALLTALAAFRAANLIGGYLSEGATRVRESSAPRLAGAALIAALGLALVVAANYDLTGELFVTRAGPSFLFGRLLQDRIVIRLLDDTCPRSGYRLCAYRDELPRTADGWLWTPRSPFFALGGFPGTAAESAHIVRDTLARYPWLHVRAALLDTAEQVLSVRTGDQIEPQQWAIAPTLERYIPSQMAAYRAARQQKGEIDFHTVNLLHAPVGLLSLVCLVLALASAIHARQRGAANVLGFALVALVANAAVCGILSGPHDRYESRLVWIAPFALVLAGAARRLDQPA